MSCVEITDADFDDMHHALGRPTLATLLADDYSRNFYVTEAGGKTAQRFEATGMWSFAHTVNSVGRDVVFTVNADGMSALADWLSLKIGGEDVRR